MDVRHEVHLPHEVPAIRRGLLITRKPIPALAQKRSTGPKRFSVSSMRRSFEPGWRRRRAEGGADLGCHHLGRGNIEIGHDDRGLLLGESPCHGGTDAATSTGDDDHPIGDVQKGAL